MVAVWIMLFQAHHGLRHLLGRVVRSRRRLELVMGAEGRIHLVSRRTSGVHHVRSSLDASQMLLQLKLGIGGEVLLLRRRSAAVVAHVEPGTSAHLGLGIGVGAGRGHLERDRDGSKRRHACAQQRLDGLRKVRDWRDGSDWVVMEVRARLKVEGAVLRKERFSHFTGLVLARQSDRRQRPNAWTGQGECIVALGWLHRNGFVSFARA